MAQMRHGTPVNMEGWVEKEGKFFRNRYKRFLRLKGGILSHHHNPQSPATWELSLNDCTVGPGVRSNELIIHLSSRRVSLFCESADQLKQWSSALKQSADSGVKDFYVIGDLLGQGAFAQVKLATDRETGEQMAVKIIKKHQYDQKEMEYILREMNIMKSVSHKNIVNTVDIFNSSKYLHIVLEFMEGGELFDIIADAGNFSEQQASQVMRDTVKGVQYLHLHGIVHRDIKPENVLCKTKSWPLNVKIADFGLANFTEDGEVRERTKSLIGTPGYVAPELVRGEQYGAAVDMWACGVLLYIMLSGRMPFYGRDDQACLRMIAVGKFDFPDREWAAISEDAKSLVRGLLQVDPDKRLTADAALQHRWLAEPNKLSAAPILNDLSQIHSSRRKFRRAVMAAVTTTRMIALGEAAAPAPGNSKGQAPVER